MPVPSASAPTSAALCLLLAAAWLAALGCGSSASPPGSARSPGAAVAAGAGAARPLLAVAVAPDARLADLPQVRDAEVSWSRDGRTLAVSARGSVQIWDLRAGRLRMVLTGAAPARGAVAFTPGEELVVATEDDTLELWSSRTGALLGTLDHRRLRPGPGGAQLARVAAWDDATSTAVGVAVSPDGNLIATRTRGADVGLWSTAGGALVGVLRGQDDARKRARAAMRTEAARARDELVGGHLAPVTSVAWSPDQKTLATASFDGTIRLWDPATAAWRATLARWAPGAAAATAATEPAPILGLGWSRDGAAIVAGTSGGEVEVWQVADRHVQSFAVSSRPEPVRTVAMSPVSHAFVTAGPDGTARAWRIGADEPFAEFGGLAAEGAGIRSAAFSPDGGIVALAGEGVVLVRLGSRERLALHTFADDAGGALGFVQADDGSFDGDPAAFERVHLELTHGDGAPERVLAADVLSELRRPNLLAEFVAARAHRRR